MPNLICSAIIGDDLLQQPKSVTFKFQGKLPELFVSTIMSVANVPFPQLFGDNLSARCKLIAIKTRKFLTIDMAIIKAETVRLLQQDRIEPSNSPWRAQPFVVDNGKKKRMCVDYNQTINLFKRLDQGFPKFLFMGTLCTITDFLVYPQNVLIFLAAKLNLL